MGGFVATKMGGFADKQYSEYLKTSHGLSLVTNSLQAGGLLAYLSQNTSNKKIYEK
jgi:hypothetical protein